MAKLVCAQAPGAPSGKLTLSGAKGGTPKEPKLALSDADVQERPLVRDRVGRRTIRAVVRVDDDGVRANPFQQALDVAAATREGANLGEVERRDQALREHRDGAHHRHERSRAFLLPVCRCAHASCGAAPGASSTPNAVR